MNKKNTDYLFKKYPKLFPKEERKDPMQSLMCFGFETGDGWVDLIDSLCSCIQTYIDNNQHLKLPQVVVEQVKEKFGGLRFYTRGGDTLIHGMIWFAESLSFSICEECGKKGIFKKSKTRNWYYTLCNECWVKKENDK